MQHHWGEPAGEDVVLAGVVAAEQVHRRARVGGSQDGPRGWPITRRSRGITQPAASTAGSTGPPAGVRRTAATHPGRDRPPLTCLPCETRDSLQVSAAQSLLPESGVVVRNPADGPAGMHRRPASRWSHASRVGLPAVSALPGSACRAHDRRDRSALRDLDSSQRWRTAALRAGLKIRHAHTTTQAAEGFVWVEGRDPSGNTVVVTHSGPEEAVRSNIITRVYAW